MDDLTGFATEPSDEWEILSFPAIAETEQLIPLLCGRMHRRQIGDVLSPTREPLPVLEQHAAATRVRLVFGAVSANPAPPGGAMIKRDWPQRYERVPTRSRDMFVRQSWDIAMKGGPENDLSVCTTWYISISEEKYFLVDVKRMRVDYPTLKRTVFEHSREWSADEVIVEDRGTGTALLQELRYEVRGLNGREPDRDKQARMAVASVKFQAGQVFLPEHAPWLEDLEAELFAFPEQSTTTK